MSIGIPKPPNEGALTDMTDENLSLYEGLFLFNPQAIEGNLQTAVDHLTEILSRAEAEVVALTRWDERKLAYPIKGQKRGLYLLAHFRVRGAQVANIERDVNLSELLLRAMVLRADQIGDIELEQVKADARKLDDLLAVSDEAAPATDAGEAEAPAPEPVEAAETAATESDDEE